MSFNSVDGDIIVAGGKSLDVMLRGILASIKSLSDNKTIPVITDLSDIGMSRETNTLSEIAQHMPMGSVATIGVSGNGLYASSLPMPTISNGSRNVYYSGQIYAVKDMNDWNKVYFWYFGVNGFTATAMYNGNISSYQFSGWKFSQSSPLITRPSPAEFDNLMENIWVSGSYYFSADQMAAFVDRPPNAAAGYLTVTNSTGLKTSDKLLEFTENKLTTHTWKRVSFSKDWTQIPSVSLLQIADSDLRIGDMRLNSSGVLVIRNSSSSVKVLS